MPIITDTRALILAGASDSEDGLSGSIETDEEPMEPRVAPDGGEDGEGAVFPLSHRASRPCHVFSYVVYCWVLLVEESLCTVCVSTPFEGPISPHKHFDLRWLLLRIGFDSLGLRFDLFEWTLVQPPLFLYSVHFLFLLFGRAWCRNNASAPARHRLGAARSFLGSLNNIFHCLPCSIPTEPQTKG